MDGVRCVQCNFHTVWSYKPHQRPVCFDCSTQIPGNFFRCAQCNFETATESSLTQHVATKHPKINNRAESLPSSGQLSGQEVNFSESSSLHWPSNNVIHIDNGARLPHRPFPPSSSDIAATKHTTKPSAESTGQLSGQEVNFSESSSLHWPSNDVIHIDNGARLPHGPFPPSSTDIAGTKHTTKPSAESTGQLSRQGVDFCESACSRVSLSSSSQWPSNDVTHIDNGARLPNGPFPSSSNDIAATKHPKPSAGSVGQLSGKEVNFSKSSSLHRPSNDVIRMDNGTRLPYVLFPPSSSDIAATKYPKPSAGSTGQVSGQEVDSSVSACSRACLSSSSQWPSNDVIHIDSARLPQGPFPPSSSDIAAMNVSRGSSSLLVMNQLVGGSPHQSVPKSQMHSQQHTNCSDPSSDDVIITSDTGLPHRPFIEPSNDIVVINDDTDDALTLLNNDEDVKEVIELPDCASQDSHHSGHNKINGKRNIKCMECYMKRRRPSERRFQCPKCPYKAREPALLRRHVYSQHVSAENKQQHQCKYCDYKTCVRLQLDQHLIDEHPLIDIGQLERTVPSGEEEQATQSNKKKTWFECYHCQYRTTYKTTLRDHIMYKHTAAEQIPWVKCDKCPYKGKRQGDLNKHIKLSHDEKAEVFKCKDCPHETKLKRDLEAHRRNNHMTPDEIDWVTCQYCSQKVKCKATLVRHIASNHVDISSVDGSVVLTLSKNAKDKVVKTEAQTIIF